MKRWRIVARDVNGDEVTEIGRRITRRGAQRLRDEWASWVPMPLPGRPLYSVHVERIE